MLRLLQRSSAFLLVLLLLPSSAQAQFAGAITGVVKDASGGVLPGVTVEAASAAREDLARAEERFEGAKRRLTDIGREIHDMLEIEPSAVAALAEIEPGEALRDSWPVDGTTGYDFLNRASGLFVDPAGEKMLTEFYAEFTGESIDWAAVARAKKHQVMRETMGSDLNRLTALFLEICERRRRFAVFAAPGIRVCLERARLRNRERVGQGIGDLLG